MGFSGRTAEKPADGIAKVVDLQSQLEELLIEVWRQESFERRHPFTCAVMREPVVRRRPAAAKP